MTATSVAERSDPLHWELGGVSLNWLFESPTIGITRWGCESRRTGLTEERTQPWPVISFVHTGSFRLNTPRGRSLVDSNSAALFNRDEPFQTDHPCGCGDRGSSVVVHPDVLRDCDPEGRTSFEQPAAPAPTAALVLQRRLLTHLAEPRADRDALWVEETGLRIVSLVMAGACSGREGGSPRPGARLRQAVEKTKVILAGRFSEPLSLALISAETGVSAFALCRAFRAAAGIPIHRYLLRLRLRAALDRLLSGRVDLSDLALDVGFSSHSHFTERFRREFGAPPSSVRSSRPAAGRTGRFR